jgi:hypothetical protein
MNTTASRRRLPAVRANRPIAPKFLLLLILAGSMAGLSGVSCRRAAQPSPPAPRLRLGAVEIQEVSAEARRTGSLDVGAIADALRRVLLSSHLVEPAASDAGDTAAAEAAATVRVTGQVGFEFTEVADKGIVRAGVSLRLVTRPSDVPGAINEELSAAGEQKYDVKPRLDRLRLGQELAERTAADLMATFAARARLRTAPPAEIHLAITGDAGALREEAIRVAGARGLRAEVPTLLLLLQNDDEAFRDAALGALIALRERRAVTELTRNRSLRDRHEMRKILEAIAILGGDEARDYLGFVAESHDDPEIRKLAVDAKRRLERQEDAASK